MKERLKRTFKTLLMIVATVMSVVSGILTDSGTLAYAATTYTLTLNWDDGVEWVATDKDGTDRWEKGGSKTFQAVFFYAINNKKALMQHIKILKNVT